MVTDFYRNIRACLIEIDNDVVNKIIILAIANEKL